MAMDFINQAKKAAAAMMQNAQNAIDQEMIEVEGQMYKVTRKLGEGGFAFVYLVEDSQMRRYALKKMLCPDADKVALAEKEIKVSKMLQQEGKHPNIVYLTASAKRTTDRGAEILMLMEFCPGALSSVIEEGDIADDAILPIFRQICEGVGVMHRCNPPLAHRDIKAENVLRGADGVWKVCDFGSATTRSKAYTTKREIADEEERIQKYSTPQYKAPEMCDLYAGKVISEKVDVWALGVLLYLLTFRKHAFPDGNNIAIMGGNYTFPSRKSDMNFGGHTRPQHLLDLIDFILKQDPDERPSVSDVIARIDSIVGRAPGSRPSSLKADAPAQSSSRTNSASAGAPNDDFFSNISSPKASSGDDFFSQASSSSFSSNDPFFSAASSSSSSQDFFSSPAPAKVESGTPKASASKSGSSVGSSGFGATTKTAPAPAGPDLLDFGASVVPKADSLDDLLDAVGGAPPPSFVSPFQGSGSKSLTDDLFGVAPSTGMGARSSGMSGNSMGFSAIGVGTGLPGQGQPAMGQVGGIGLQGAQVMGQYGGGMGGLQGMQMQMGNMNIGGMQGMTGMGFGIPMQQSIGGGLMGMGSGMPSGMVGNVGQGMGAASVPSTFKRVLMHDWCSAAVLLLIIY
jgi:serine/threonine protein kinase